MKVILINRRTLLTLFALMFVSLKSAANPRKRRVTVTFNYDFNLESCLFADAHTELRKTV